MAVKVMRVYRSVVMLSMLLVLVGIEGAATGLLKRHQSANAAIDLTGPFSYRKPRPSRVCSICQNIIPEGYGYEANCGHYYHSECLVSHLEEHGLHCRICNRNFFTPLNAIVSDVIVNHGLIGEVRAHRNDAIKFLLEQRHADRNVIALNGDPVLIIALKYENFESVSLLLDHGANPDAVSSEGFPALHLAVMKNQDDLVQKLLDIGADHLAVSHEGEIAYQKALSSRQSGTVDLPDCAVTLLYHAAYKPTSQTADGRTFLMICTQMFDVNCLHFVLGQQSGFESLFINIQSLEGKTALIYAAQFGVNEMIIELLNHGADISLKDQNGWTACDYAVTSAMRYQGFSEDEHRKCLERLCPVQHNLNSNVNAVDIAEKKDG